MFNYEKPIAQIIELCPAEKQMLELSDGGLEEWAFEEDEEV